MSIKRIITIAKKEFIHIRRDRRSLILSFMIPVVLLILFGYALTLDVKNIPTTILNYDNGEYSREFISSFSQSGYFAINDYIYDHDQLEENILSGNSMVAIVIPPDFSKNLAAGKNARVQTIIDGSSANKASIANGYIEGITRSFYSNITSARTVIDEIGTPLDPDIRIWFNPELESKNFIIPGIIAIILMMIASLLTSQVVSREWENGTMEQLIVSPIRPQELILGKIIPYFVIGILDMAVIVIFGRLLFNIPIKGNAILLFILSSLFLFGALSLGITISIVTKTQVLSYQVAMLISFLPSYILSGLVFPISSMPKVIQYISYLVPAKYFIIILRGIFLKGSGFMILLLDILYLTIFAIIVFIIANLRFIKKLTR
jgi:ABC-2 type transport system permease protein